MVTTIEGSLPSEVFYQDFVRKGRPVLLKGGISNWDACSTWDMNYFKNIRCDRKLTVKNSNIAEGETEEITLEDYIKLLIEFNAGLAISSPPYLHDVGLFSIIPELKNDVSSSSIKEYLPKFYHRNWWKYAQFFMSIKGHTTPLHFDTLITHNIFFQIRGKKRFTLIPWEERAGCYIHNWRWAQINPIDPDLGKFGEYSKVTPLVVEIEGGDILYMPAGMLHHVESLSYSISFNIDWHSKRSVLKGLLSCFQGAPRKNTAYNFLIFLAVWCKVPERYIWPYYKTYLNYIS